MEVSSEGKSGMVKSLVSSRYEAASFDYVMALVETRSREVFIDWMDLEFIEGVNRSNGMLPYISYQIEELSIFEHVNRVRRKPIFHIDVSDLLVFPVRLIFLHDISHRVPLIFSR